MDGGVDRHTYTTRALTLMMLSTVSDDASWCVALLASTASIVSIHSIVFNNPTPRFIHSIVIRENVPYIYRPPPFLYKQYILFQGNFKDILRDVEPKRYTPGIVKEMEASKHNSWSTVLETHQAPIF